MPFNPQEAEGLGMYPGMGADGACSPPMLSPQVDMDGMHRAKRRRFEPIVAGMRFSRFVPKIRSYIGSIGGETALSAQLEQPRMQLLIEACKKEDGFFVALHQLFAIWSLNRVQAQQYLAPLPPDVADAAFSIVEQVLKKNDSLSPSTLDWFARFPLPIQEILLPDTSYSFTVGAVSVFLDKLSRVFGRMVQAALGRHYPYLVDELLGELSCNSVGLQKILFTACRRRLGVPDGQLAQQMDATFLEDLQRHTDPSGALVPMLTPLGAAELAQRNAAVVRKYQFLVEHGRRYQQSAATSQRFVPSPAHSNPQSPAIQHANITQLRRDSLPDNHERGASYGYDPPQQPGVSASSVPQVLQVAAPPQASTQSPSLVQAGFVPQTQQGTPGMAPGLILQSNVSHGQPPAIFTPVAAATVQQGQGYIPGPGLPNQHQFHQVQQAQQVQQAPAIQQGQLAQHVQHPQQNQPAQVTQQGQPAQDAQHFQQVLRQQAMQQQFTLSMQQAQQMAQYQVPAPQPPIPALRPVPAAQYPIASPAAAPVVSVIPNQVPPQPQPQPSFFSGSVFMPSVQQGVPANQQQFWPLQPGLFHLPLHLLPPPGQFIQRPEVPYDANDRKSVLMSLHQAHVRSPRRVRRASKNGERPERYYQAVKSLPLSPTAIPPQSCIYDFEFTISDEEFGLSSKVEKEEGTLLSVSDYFDGSLRWRLRCCQTTNGAKHVDENDWMSMESHWPKHIHMTLNSNALTIRRASHNGKDLPVELTPYIVPGKNVLRVAVSPSASKAAAANFHLVAVEMLETLPHSDVMMLVRKQGFLPEEETLNKIKSRLARQSDDDGISVALEELSIDLADPFSATIFQVPARGVDCTHLECFDLETWLNTRPGKPVARCPHRAFSCTCPKDQEPSNPDKWRCPICFKDARPYSLRIDTFLLKVRAQLEQEGKLQAKSMLVAPDGSWNAVVEEEDDADSDDDGTPVAPRKMAWGRATVPKESVVIDLLDD